MRESESEAAQWGLTGSDPMDCSLPGSSVHGIFQGRVLEWVAIAFCSIPDQVQLKKASNFLIYCNLTLPVWTLRCHREQNMEGEIVPF